MSHRGLACPPAERHPRSNVRVSPRASVAGYACGHGCVPMIVYIYAPAVIDVCSPINVFIVTQVSIADDKITHGAGFPCTLN